MPLVDAINIACGFHAGDPAIMAATVSLALKYRVAIGAHPAYPDLQGFGRRSMAMTAQQIQQLICYQVGALDGIVRAQNGRLSHVKPHGALYNDMMADPAIMTAVMQAVANLRADLVLVIQATPQWQAHQALAERLGIVLWFEGFADRGYQDCGLLIPRQQQGALHSACEAIAQGKNMLKTGEVKSHSGKTLNLMIDTLCIHGDGENALEIAGALARYRNKEQHTNGNRLEQE